MVKKDHSYPLISAIKGMLPKNKLSDAVIKKVKIYEGEEHPHAAQKPVRVEIADKVK